MKIASFSKDLARSRRPPLATPGISLPHSGVNPERASSAGRMMDVEGPACWELWRRVGSQDLNSGRSQPTDTSRAARSAARPHMSSHPERPPSAAADDGSRRTRISASPAESCRSAPHWLPPVFSVPRSLGRCSIVPFIVQSSTASRFPPLLRSLRLTTQNEFPRTTNPQQERCTERSCPKLPTSHSQPSPPPFCAPRAPRRPPKFPSVLELSLSAPTATTTTLPITARPTATTGPTGLTAESSSAPATGTTAATTSTAMSTTATTRITATADRCPQRGEEPFNHFHGNEARDGRGHTGHADHEAGTEHNLPGYRGGDHR